MVAPSDMMDGRVARDPRGARRGAGFERAGDPVLRGEVRVGLLRPVPRGGRLRARSSGDRRGYQMDPGQRPRGAARGRLDVEDEGADILMVKPALPYLDVIRARAGAHRPAVAAYNVSGEYAMVKAAAAQGLDRRGARRCSRSLTVDPPRRRRPDPHLPREGRRAVAEADRRERGDALARAVRARAGRSIPGGVNCPVRAFRAVGRHAALHRARRGRARLGRRRQRATSTTSARGARSSWATPHPEVVDGVQAAAARGTSFGAPTRARGRARRARCVEARARASRWCASSRSGTEATMSALRAGARLHRPRHDRQVRRLLPRPRRRAAGRRPARASRRSASPASAGVPAGVAVADTLVAAVQRPRRR